MDSTGFLAGAAFFTGSAFFTGAFVTATFFFTGAFVTATFLAGVFFAGSAFLATTFLATTFFAAGAAFLAATGFFAGAALLTAFFATEACTGAFLAGLAADLGADLAAFATGFFAATNRYSFILPLRRESALLYPAKHIAATAPTCSGFSFHIVIGKFLIAMLRGYKRFISPMLGTNCRFVPTCSEYAMQAIAQFGAAKGSWLALRRVGRCHPLNPGGHDPIPPSKDSP